MVFVAKNCFLLMSRMCSEITWLWQLSPLTSLPYTFITYCIYMHDLLLNLYIFHALLAFHNIFHMNECCFCGIIFFWACSVFLCFVLCLLLCFFIYRICLLLLWPRVCNTLHNHTPQFMYYCFTLSYYSLVYFVSEKKHNWHQSVVAWMGVLIFYNQPEQEP